MKALAIAYSNLRRMLRDRSSIFFVFIFPIAIILLVGIQFGGGVRPEVGIYQDGAGGLSDAVVAELEASTAFLTERFDSKEDLARAVLETAVERYRFCAERWLARTDLGSLDVLHGMVDEIALRLEHDTIVQAEYRLVIEPDFHRDAGNGGGRIVGRATRVLAVRAIDDGQLRADADPDRFTRTLAAALAGQRYLVDPISNGSAADLRARFAEVLEVIVEAMATPLWIQNFRSDGWRAQARLDDLGLGA